MHDASVPQDIENSWVRRRNADLTTLAVRSWDMQEEDVGILQFTGEALPPFAWSRKTLQYEDSPLHGPASSQSVLLTAELRITRESGSLERLAVSDRKDPEGCQHLRNMLSKKFHKGDQEKPTEWHYATRAESRRARSEARFTHTVLAVWLGKRCSTLRHSASMPARCQ